MSSGNFRGFTNNDRYRFEMDMKVELSVKRQQALMARDRGFMPAPSTSGFQEDNMEMLVEEYNNNTENGPYGPQIKGATRGMLLWRTFQELRKGIAKVGQPLTASMRRSLERQLLSKVDDLEKIVLGVKPIIPDLSDESSDDEELRRKVTSIVQDVLDGDSKKGNIVRADIFEKRMKQVENECSNLRKQLGGISAPKSVNSAKDSKKAPTQYIPISTTRVPNTEMILETPTPCTVCGVVAALIGGWRCVSCKNFWSRLCRKYQQGKELPSCNHFEIVTDCKGCRRRMYETKYNAFMKGKPIGIPLCLPRSANTQQLQTLDNLGIREESREIGIEEW